MVDMFASVGAHEGYACPEGIEEYTIYFDKSEKLTTNVLRGNLLSKEDVLLGENVNSLQLKQEYFVVDALTLLNLKSRSVMLKNKAGDRNIRVDFDGFDYLFVWTKPNAKYICIEPWSGLPDFESAGYDITQKRGISRIASGETLEKTHSITIL